ncbi:hypothetical protein AAG906_026610 [Vitis piasezkii]
MEGEEFLYLYTYHRILVINMKKLLSGGFQTAPPDMTRLPVDEVIDFDEEKLPFKGRQGISSSLYVADLSGPTVNFTHVHEFEAAKLMPRLIKIEGRIYVMSSSYSYYAKFRTCASPSFESYCPGRYYEPNTMLQTPPFHGFNERIVTGFARSLLIAAIWRNTILILPPYGGIPFPPPESGEDAPVLFQKFEEVECDLSKIAKCHWRIGDGLVLNLGKEKMCAIFHGHCNPNHNFLVYIFIFKFPNCRPMNNNILPSKPSEPRAPKYVLSQHQRISYPSLVCTRVVTTWMTLAMITHAQPVPSVCKCLFHLLCYAYILKCNATLTA